MKPPLFVGYLPKRTVVRPDWLRKASVTAICSVSECISRGSENRISEWKHNQWGFYDTESSALEVVGHDLNEFDLYAYRLFPFRWIEEREEPFDIVPSSGEIGEAYTLLGYDIVTNSSGSYFECSPLSCNSAADQYTVNQFCLIDNPEQAYRVLMELSRAGNYEPGPYYLVEVYRKNIRAL